MVRISIVDKNIQKLEGVVSYLKGLGFEVNTFDAISKFQSFFKKNTHNLVICDPIIEGASPYFIVKWIKDSGKSVPIIVYSSKPSKEIIMGAKKFGINAFMVFPFKNEELYLRIKKILKLPDNFTIESKHEKGQLKIIEKEKTKNEILMNIDKLPSFPAVIREVERLISKDESSAKDFEEIIEKDQVITAKILKIVNSPFYSLARKFTTISESVAYIGLDSLRSIIYSASVSNLLKISIPTYGYKREQLWKHSYTTAILAKTLAKYLKMNDKLGEELFVGGLIHDIGKIVIGVLAKKQNLIIIKKKEDFDNLLDMEREHFYFTHEEIGGLIADKWRLPDIHKQIIMHHHNPVNINSAVVALSNLMSQDLIGMDITEKGKETQSKICNSLKIDEDELDKIKEEIIDLVNSIEQEGIF